MKIDYQPEQEKDQANKWQSLKKNTAVSTANESPEERDLKYKRKKKNK